MVKLRTCKNDKELADYLTGKTVYAFGAGRYIDDFIEFSDAGIEKLITVFVDNNSELDGTIKTVKGAAMPIISP